MAIARTRLLGIVTVGAVVAVGVAGLPAGAAHALPTLPCNQKGTAGPDTINVSVPSGRTAPWVVCAGGGADTINVNTIETGATPSNLYLAMGAGQKTVNWNAGSLGGVGWGADVLGWGPSGTAGEGIIVRPNASPNIIAGGSNSSSGAVGFVCATNADYVAATSQTNLYLGFGAIYLGWQNNFTFNGAGC